MRNLTSIFLVLLSTGTLANPDSLRNVALGGGADISRIDASEDLVSYYEFRDTDSCRFFADLMLELSKDNPKVYRMKSLYNLGIAHYRIQDYDECIQSCEEAHTISKAIADTIYEGYILYKLSRAYSKIGRYDLTIQAQLDAIRFFDERSNDAGVGVMYNNMSIAYKYLGDHRDAIRVLKLAYQYYVKAEMTNAYFTPYLNIGDNYLQIGILDSALNYLDSAIALAQEYSQDEPYIPDYIKYWKGEVFYKRGEYEKALEYYIPAHETRLENYDRDAQVYTYLALGQTHHKLGDLSKAQSLLDTALQMATEVNATKRIMMSNEALAQLHLDKGEWKESAIHFKEYSALRDTMFNREKSMAIMSARTEFQVEAKDKEIEMLSMEAEMAEKEKKLADAELKRSQTQQLLLYSGLGFAVIFIGGLFVAIRRRNILNNTLKDQKQEITLQKDIVEEKNKEIVDSINYAKRIQAAILPSRKVVAQYLENSFILYKPKDIVAGDFYWMEKSDGILIAACDCTGHGVPGAMVSVVCNNGLNRSVREHGLSEPAKILDKTREIVIQEFEKSEDEVQDGMDISLVKLTGNSIEFAGANNPLWIIRKGSDEVEEIRGDKQPIGKFEHATAFSNHKVNLSSGDTFYIFSDGYADQFGGEKGKKMKTSNFKKLLLSIQDKSMNMQRDIIDELFENWRGDLEQIDDVCVIGIRI